MLGFPIRGAIYAWISNKNDFSYFDLLVTLMLHIKFQDNWPPMEKPKKDFQDAMVAILDFPLEQF